MVPITFPTSTSTPRLMSPTLDEVVQEEWVEQQFRSTHPVFTALAVRHDSGGVDHERARNPIRLVVVEAARQIAIANLTSAP